MSISAKAVNRKVKRKIVVWNGRQLAVWMSMHIAQWSLKMQRKWCDACTRDTRNIMSPICFFFPERPAFFISPWSKRYRDSKIRIAGTHARGHICTLSVGWLATLILLSKQKLIKYRQLDFFLLSLWDCTLAVSRLPWHRFISTVNKYSAEFGPDKNKTKQNKQKIKYIHFINVSRTEKK